MTDSRKITLDEFIKRSREKHGDKFDYSLITDYGGAEARVKIRCVEHDHVFETQSNNHYIGKNGCVFCEGTTGRHTTETFIKKSRMVHGDRFDYSEVEYVNNRTHVKIYCKEHDHWFTQPPKKHMVGRVGCTFCSGTVSYSNDEYIKAAKMKWGDRFEYLHIDYKNSKSVITARCIEHNRVFTSAAYSHLQHVSCPSCKNQSTSCQEKDLISFVESITSDVESNKYFYIDGMKREFDLVLKDEKLLIEYNGNYWHSHRQRPSNYHKEKLNFAHNLDCNLLMLWEYQWCDDRMREVIKRLLSGYINKLIYSKGEISVVKDFTHDLIADFLNKYDLSRDLRFSDNNYSMIWKDHIVGFMSFVINDPKTSKVEKVCIRPEFRKSFSSIVDRFIVDHRGCNLVAFSDDQNNEQELYQSCGFLKVRECDPDFLIYNHRSGVTDKDYWGQSSIKKRVRDFGYKVDVPNVITDDVLLDLQDSCNVNRIYDCGRTEWLLTGN
jgi:hypothetical protein